MHKDTCTCMCLTGHLAIYLKTFLLKIFTIFQSRHDEVPSFHHLWPPVLQVCVFSTLYQ